MFRFIKTSSDQYLTYEGTYWPEDGLTNGNM